MKLNDIKLGQRVCDSVLRIVGQVTVKAEYQHGESCVQIELIDSTGRPISHWVPVSRLTPDE